MKTEREWLDAIAERVRAGRDGSLLNSDALALVEQALAEHPSSVRLWNVRGDLIQISEGEEYSLQDALTSYQRAVDLDPQDPEAYESMGYFFDIVEDRVADAEPMFRRAVALGARASAWAGLARVIAELGRKEEALALLDPSSCAYANESEVNEVREEIRDGIWNGLAG